MSSLEGFARRMKMRGNNVPREVNKVKRLTALAIDQALVLGTPVNEGTARSNWLVSTDTPRGDIIGAYVKLTGGDMSERANADAAMAQGRAVVDQAKPGHDIHLTNNLDYIMALNEGSSAQAPAAFVEEAVEAGVTAARGAKINTGKRT